MRVVNYIDRYHLVIDTVRLLGNTNVELKNYCISKLKEHHDLIRSTGKELDEVENFKWTD
jgi:phosphoketolase